MPEEKKEEPKKETPPPPHKGQAAPPPPPPLPAETKAKPAPQPITVKVYTYKLQKYDPARNFERVAIVELQPMPSVARHDQIVCEVGFT